MPLAELAERARTGDVRAQVGLAERLDAQALATLEWVLSQFIRSRPVAMGR